MHRHMHIVIAHPENFSKQFEIAEKPFEGQILELSLTDDLSARSFFRVHEVTPPPGGLSGVFSFQVTLREVRGKYIPSAWTRCTVSEYNT
jgi:hypothetical protein